MLVVLPSSNLVQGHILLGLLSRLVDGILQWLLDLKMYLLQ